MTDFAQLEARLGRKFKDRALLRLALTHPSVAHEQAAGVAHNQRLEFLGDAVLGLVLTRELYARFPNLGEGAMTKARARLVNRRSLADQARRLGLGDDLILSRGEESTGGRDRSSALADAFEALLGAVFLDGGFDAAREFVLPWFEDSFRDVESAAALENPKGELQELLQARSPRAPRYDVLGSSGPDHDRSFECAVYHDDVELGRGRGKSKKEAESAAAREALTRLRKDADPADA